MNGRRARAIRRASEFLASQSRYRSLNVSAKTIARRIRRVGYLEHAIPGAQQ